MPPGTYTPELQARPERRELAAWTVLEALVLEAPVPVELEADADAVPASPRAISNGAAAATDVMRMNWRMRVLGTLGPLAIRRVPFLACPAASAFRRLMNTVGRHLRH